MVYEQKEMMGYIFPNKFHDPQKNSPKARGECLINGKPHEISIWPQKEGKKGSFFKISLKQDRAQQKPPAANVPPAQVGGVEDLPF